MSYEIGHFISQNDDMPLPPFCIGLDSFILNSREALELLSP